MNKQTRAIGFCGLLLLTLWMAGCAQNTPEAVFNRGYRALEEGDIIGSSLYFEEFINKFPDDERTLKVYELLANCHLLLKDFGNARAVFEAVREKFGSNPNIAMSCDFQIGRTYVDEGNFKKAEAQFGQIASATTNPLIQFDAHRSLAFIYARQTQAASAETEFDTMYQIADQHVSDPTQSFYMKLETLVGDADKAIGKADIYKASKEFDKARAVYTQSMALIDSVTGIAGLPFEKQNALFRWAHTWAEAEDYISAATTYDRLLENPAVMDNWKPQLIVWKIQSLERLLQETNKKEYTPEEIALLVHENDRLVKDYPTTQQGIQAMVRIATLVKNSTPEMSTESLKKAVDSYEKQIAEPSSPQGPMNAMLAIADAYIRLEKYTEAKQAIERVKKSYSNVPDGVRQADGMLYFIAQQEQKAKASGPVPGASPEVKQ